MALSKLTMEARGTPILRHRFCTACQREAHFLWNPAQAAYLCLQCRGVLFYDADTDYYETRPNEALDATKPWTPPPLPPQAHDHLLKVQRLRESPPPPGPQD